MVHGYRHGSICLISVKLCYGLIFDLVQLFLFCFVCLFVFVFVFVFFVFVFLVVVGGCKLRSGRGSILGDVFFIFFPCCYGLGLWLVGVTMEVVEVADAIVLFIINLMNYLYYFK